MSLPRPIASKYKEEEVAGQGVGGLSGESSKKVGECVLVRLYRK